MNVTEQTPVDAPENATRCATARLPLPSVVLGIVGLALLAASGVMAWRHYNTPSDAVSLVTIEDAEREIEGVAEEIQDLRFEISNGWDRPIRIVGLADC